MSEFRFADPEWALALWAVVAFVALLFWLDRRGSSAIGRMLGAAMQARLVVRAGGGRRALRIALYGLAAACMVAALMRPQWGLRHLAAPRVGAELMICLDVSRSMLADDVAPSRLERAKAEIVDLLGYLDGDQVGLIAFAGRASVISPMTPDFSFLRLVLEGAGPHSVARGGTRLEEPIRRAIAGFGEAGPAQRAILLITDGEDHGSFPLDAAKAAAEAGIKIIAIGFGDEAGSEIFVTDPKTGARSPLRDGDGRPVISRLDGELLRELALATGGAYVPAGTGVLDLESIYAEHIARLTRGALDPHGHSVRDEVYQWVVLLAIVLLVAGAAVEGGRGDSRSEKTVRRRGARRAGAVAGLAAALLIPTVTAPARAEPHSEAGDAADLLVTDAAEPVDAGVDAEESGDRNAEAESQAAEASEEPRELYNQGSAALTGSDVEGAELLLARARRAAGGDSELRFRSAYNLGIAAFARAEQQESESPAEALEALYEAADWFREAVRQRPEAEDPRHNLEVALRRALILADAIAKQKDSGLEGELEQLEQSQRALVAQTAQLLAQIAEDPDLHAPDRLRDVFSGHATAQRVLLSDADAIAKTVGEERDALAAVPPDESTPQDQMRAAQLEGVLHYLHGARERMGQTRRQLRQRHAERSYRRASAALVEIKQARDQLRNPAAVLDLVVREVAQVRAETELLAATRRTLQGPDTGDGAPAWLTRESLAESHDAATARTRELESRLLAGLSGTAADAPPEQVDFITAVEQATPFVEEGHRELERASRAIATDQLPTALEHQRAALSALLEARERFFDLRGLIEAATEAERRITAATAAPDDAAKQARAEMLPALLRFQAKNLERAERLEQRLQDERAKILAAAAGDSTGSTGTQPEQAAALERNAVASQLLTQALAGMDAVQRDLGPAAGANSDRVDWNEVEASSARALEALEALRRLFFSIAEHVRDLARRQLDLGDRTQDAVALARHADAPAADTQEPNPDAAAPAAPRVAALDDASRTRLARLAPEQGSLAELAGELANALVEQSEQAAPAEAEAKHASQRLRLAGEHVVMAQTEMEGAQGALEGSAENALDALRPHQELALEELREALALLEPPPQQNEQEQQQEQQQQQQPQQQEQAGGGEDQQPRPDAGPAQDPAQLLQAVRDREAQRRRERERRQSAGYEPVEKDW